MTRICIIRHSYYPDIPPTRRDAETLVSHGYEVDVICSRKKGEKGREVIRGVNIYRLPLGHYRGGALRYIFEYSAFFLLAFWKLTWLSLRRRYQVVEVDAMPDFLTFATVFVKLMGAMVVLNLLDSVPHVYADKYNLSPSHIIIRFLVLVERASIRNADHLIVPNGRLKQIMEGRGIPNSKMSLILNVPEENIFNLQTFPPKGQERGDFQVITHGSLLEKYGVQMLIKAVPLLIPHIPELKVEVVGDGEYRPYLEGLVRALGVEDYVHFAGFVPMEKVPSFISQADIGVVCTLIEMLPTKLFEYAALGKPIIASAFPAMKDYFNNGAVMYYEPGDEHELAHCILELYANPESRAALATSAAAIYQRYRWSTLKYEYLKVFERLADPQHLSLVGCEGDTKSPSQPTSTYGKPRNSAEREGRY